MGGSISAKSVVKKGCNFTFTMLCQIIEIASKESKISSTKKVKKISVPFTAITEKTNEEDSLIED